ncbi:MAG: AmmeMemoRadiSam system protein A [Patescibacteria group bacterium]|nr:AmmeMemoRadiSam system protein A [Patescibacteria group bacterium]
MKEYAALAKQAIQAYLRDKKVIKSPSSLPGELLKTRAAVFVTLHFKGDLRGCIGTLAPAQDNVALEIIHNAISAAVNDFRFLPLTLPELEQTEISVSILSQPQPTTIERLDPKKFGVIVRSNSKVGVLLPDIEGVETVEEQIQIACQKAGIKYPKEPFELSCFTVTLHKSEP